MNARKAWQLITLVTVFSLLVTACGNVQPTAAVPPTAVPATAIPNTAVPPTAIPPTAVPPTTIPPTAAPVATQTAMATLAAVAPLEVQVCALLTVGPDTGWDGTFLNDFAQIVATQPIKGVTVKPLKYVTGLSDADGQAAMVNYAKTGCDIVWPHGGYNTQVEAINKDYPNTMFVEVGSGVINYGQNDYHFWLRCYEASYLMGVLAGNMSKSNVFGAVGTYPASDVNDAINSFFDGARSVKGNIVQKVAFVNSWYDPTAANEAANAQIAAGAKQIDMYAETYDACAAGGIICYGAYNDYSKTYPKTVLASFTISWVPALTWTLEEWAKAKAAGTGFNAPENPTFSMSNQHACDVKLSDTLSSTIPSDVLATFNKDRQGILDGSLKITFDDSLPASK